MIDIDRPDTWPDRVKEWAQGASEEQGGAIESVGDIVLSAEGEDPAGEDEFRSLLVGHLIRGYHATRLLVHEVDAVCREGLRLLSEELVTDRISSAHRNGHISDSERDRLLAKHVARHSNRAGRVACFLTEYPMKDRWRGLGTLLATWGGEAIYWGHGRDEVMTDRLRSLGQPSIVVVGLDLSEGWRTRGLVSPDLRRVFLGRFLELEDVSASVHYREPVPAEHVLSVWQPGDPEYDRHGGLPTD